MKRSVLCVFLLILYLLLVCTMLSAKIEEEMATLVQVERRTSSKGTGRTMTLDFRAVFTDSEGDHLYEVREGEGWSHGLRAYEVTGFSLDFMQGVVTLYGPRDYSFVKSASRQPKDGELVKIVEEFEMGKDTYLYCYKYGVPEELDMPPYLTVVGQSESALLIENSEGTFPFLPHTAKTWTVTTDAANRVFSLTEAEMFLNELPKVACVFAIIFVGVGIWLVSCCLNIRKCKIASLGWLNITLVIVSLCVVQWALKGIDLPASILPSNNIFQWDYYWAEYSVMIDELKKLGLLEHSLIKTVSQITKECKYIMLTGIIVSCGIACGEIIVLRVDQLLADKQ